MTNQGPWVLWVFFWMRAFNSQKGNFLCGRKGLWTWTWSLTRTCPPTTGYGSHVFFGWKLWAFRNEKIVDSDFKSYSGLSSNWQDQPEPMGLFDRPRFPLWKYTYIGVSEPSQSQLTKKTNKPGNQRASRVTLARALTTLNVASAQLVDGKQVNFTTKLFWWKNCFTWLSESVNMFCTAGKL